MLVDVSVDHIRSPFASRSSPNLLRRAIADHMCRKSTSRRRIEGIRFVVPHTYVLPPLHVISDVSRTWRSKVGGT